MKLHPYVSDKHQMDFPEVCGSPTVFWRCGEEDLVSTPLVHRPRPRPSLETPSPRQILPTGLLTPWARGLFHGEWKRSGLKLHRDSRVNRAAALPAGSERATLTLSAEDIWRVLQLQPSRFSLFLKQGVPLAGKRQTRELCGVAWQTALNHRHRDYDTFAV